MGTPDVAVKSLLQVVDIFVELGDRRAEGGAHFAIADLLLGKLTEEVETETLAEYEKNPKELELKLTTDDVYRRGEEGLEYAGRSFECYEAVGDEPGMEAVQEVIRTSFQRGVDLYAKVCEPDLIVDIKRR